MTRDTARTLRPDSGGILFLLSLIVAVMVLGVAPGCGYSPPPLDQAILAYATKSWPRAEQAARAALAADPTNAEASLWLARALAKQGKSVPARGLIAPRGGASLQARDLAWLGSGLVDDGRVPLGWAMIEAAARLAPSDPEVTSPQARLNQRTDVLVPHATVIGRLSAVPDPRALAEFAVGLMALDPDATQGDATPFDSLLDQASSLPIDDFKSLRSPDSARRLLARLLLAESRPGEALDWLEKVESEGDPETSWLRGRAALSGGSDDSHELPALPGRSPMDHEPCGYAGAKRCAECHSDIYNSQQASRHSRTITRPQGLDRLPWPEAEIADSLAPGVHHRFLKDGSRVEAEATAGGETFRAIVAYAIGSGRHGMTLLGERPDGAKLEMRMSYYGGGSVWDVTEGFSPTAGAPIDYLGNPITERGFRECLNCHSTRFRSLHAPPTPELQDDGIGCERCHGPGSNHVQAIQIGWPDPAIARPKHATAAERFALCASCHSSTGKIPPTDPRFIRFQGATLPYSRCYTESSGKLDCVACHDPHQDVAKDPIHYEARCLACHGGERSPPPPTIRMESVAASPCPVNAASNCLECHMPKIDKIMPFTTMTDHHIRVRRGSTARVEEARP